MTATRMGFLICNDLEVAARIVQTEPVSIGQKAVEVRAWKHIPYAAPPVGDLRWRAPEPATCWRGTRDATTFGPKCPQLDGGVVVGLRDVDRRRAVRGESSRT